MKAPKKSELKVESLFIATNPATHRGVLSWSPKCGLLAFASDCLVYLSSLPELSTYCSLRGHSKTVTAIKWVDGLDADPHSWSLLSASSDCSLIHWRGQGNPAAYSSWTCAHVYSNAHKAPIELLASLANRGTVYVLSYSIDGELVYWRNKGDSLEVVHKLLFSKSLLESATMHALGPETVLVALGSFNNAIHLYTHTVGTNELVYRCSLTGHQNSVRDLAFVSLPDEAILASGSMDGSIRLWKIRQLRQEAMKEQGVALPGVSEDIQLHEQYISKTSYVFPCANPTDCYNVVLESVLSYHTEGINSLQWGRKPGQVVTGKETIMDLCLLSSSIDGAVCCWETSKDSGGAWVVRSTFGEMIAGSRNAMYGALFSRPDCTEIVAYAYNGCMLRWVLNLASQKWESALAFTGHFGPVNDVLWDPNDQLLISCSSDMQTKVYGQWRLAKEERLRGGWHEISRPQIHGYEVNAIVCLPSFAIVGPSADYATPYRLVSASDEKVLRVFDPPFLFMKTANVLCESKLKFAADCDNAAYEERHTKSLTAAGASISQPLTLMNRPVALVENEEEYNPSNFDPENFLTNKSDPLAAEASRRTFLDKMEPPQEHFLSNYGLWPETQKMYGHAYEVQALAVSHNGLFIASSANSNKPKDSYIMVWDAQTLKQVRRLAGHQLSVSQLEFSHDDRRLLSVGRDRQWILWGDSETQHSLIQKQPEAHSRVIWSCSWASDSKLFATASREKKQSVKFWARCPSEAEQWTLHSAISGLQNVTAVRFFPPITVGDSVLRVLTGTEEGLLSVWQREADRWTLLHSVHPNLCHAAPVQRLAFNRRYSRENPGSWLVATGSADRSVRLFRFTQ